MYSYPGAPVRKGVCDNIRTAVWRKVSQAYVNYAAQGIDNPAVAIRDHVDVRVMVQVLDSIEDQLIEDLKDE